MSNDDALEQTRCQADTMSHMFSVGCAREAAHQDDATLPVTGVLFRERTLRNLV